MGRYTVFEPNMHARNRVHCHYMIALGSLGLGDHTSACQHFAAVLALDANHLGAVLHCRLLPQEKP